MRSGIDDQALQHEARLVKGAAGGDEGLGHRHPLELPGARGALVVGRHRVEHQAGMLAHDLGRGEDELAGDRVALLRHGARTSRGPPRRARRPRRPPSASSA